MARKKLIAGNWKMYKTPEQTTTFFQEFLPLVAEHDRDEIAVCRTLHRSANRGSGCGRLQRRCRSAKHALGKRGRVHRRSLRCQMLNSIGVTHVIIGHSERRQYFNETDDTVNRKLELALESGLTPIVCVGEVLEEREAGLTEDVLRRQCMRAFNGISARKAAQLTVAYEPVWAIGTGKTATPQMAVGCALGHPSAKRARHSARNLPTTCAFFTGAA